MKPALKPKTLLILAATLLGPALAGHALAGDQIRHTGKVTGAALSALKQKRLNDCEAAFRKHGDGNGPSYFDPACPDHFISVANPAAVKQTEDGMLVAAAHRNLLVIKRYTKNDKGMYHGEDTVIAGSMTGLQGAQALALDATHGEVLVLEGSRGAILAFAMASSSGNVAPLRQIDTPEIKGASAIAVDPASGELFVLNNRTSEIQVLSRLANSQGHAPESATDVVRSIGGARNPMIHGSSLAVDPAHGELFVADDGGNQILVFDLHASGNVAPIRILRGPSTQLSGPIGVSLSNFDELVVNNGDGKRLLYPRASDGDTAPVAPAF